MGGEINGLDHDTQLKFGAWVSRSIDTVYLAATDGFVLVSLTQPGWVFLTGKSSAANPPAVKMYDLSYQSAGQDYAGMEFLVRKDEYWKVETSSGAPTVYWIPLEEVVIRP
ncbi:MAG: hypothetical protein FVQ80_15270 [Planctomycetes bacterium]|nr:hypothetical protein [Planctomycetota bacterium]